MKIAILCYHGPIKYWDDKSIYSGIPGSEEAVIYLGKELAKEHKVDIYASPENNLFAQNPRYLNCDLWDNNENLESYDLVLSWRQHDLKRAKKRGGKVFIWLHDKTYYNKEQLKFNCLEKFDSYLFLSESHKKQYSYYANFRDIKWKIIGNGIVPEHFPLEDIKKRENPFSIGYFSNYARGLKVLLDIWPEIKKSFPKATLTICYGKNTWGLMNAKQEEEMLNLIKQLKELDVIEKGMLNHFELAETMKKTSIWSYPCIDVSQETFCITAIKAQASGMIPVYIRKGVFKEVVDKENSYFLEKLNVKEYKDLLLKVLSFIEEKEIEEKRKNLWKYAIQFSWKRTSDRILSEYYHC